MSIKKNIFAPWSKGLGATRRAAALLLVMLLTATTAAWATTTSTINVGGTDYTLFTGFTATSGTNVNAAAYNYPKLVDGNLDGSSSWHLNGEAQPYYIEFNSDDPIIPKGYIFNTYSADNFKPTNWVLKAKADAGDSWTTLSSKSGQSLENGQEFQYACDNSGNNAYKYFRFEVSNNSNNIWLTEIRLYGSIPNVYYTHLTVRDATCTETGIKQDCYQRNDGKYFTDETGATELAESDVIAPMIPHSGEHHEATNVNIEYWQCSMCSKYFSDGAYTTEITEEDTKIYRTITIDNGISGLVTSSVDKALAGATVTLTVSHLIDTSTLQVNSGSVTLTEVGGGTYTFTIPAADVIVTASILSTYSITLPANMAIVSATNAADSNGKYISGTVIKFAASFGYAATNVSDGTNTLEPDADGIYTVTVAEADINITATTESSNTIYLARATTDFTAVDGNILIGSTSHTVTIANNAKITLSDVTITGGIVCAGTAEITLVGTNSISGLSRYDSNIDAYRYTAGIQVGGSGTTLTIKGNGSLTANGALHSAGIGLSRAWDVDATGGDIVIEGGTITATGNGKGAGIGTGASMGDKSDKTATLGNITIKGGTVRAIAGTDNDYPGNGIGKGGAYSFGHAVVGTITIYDGIDMVDASSISESVTYMHVDNETETNVTASASTYFTIIEDGNRRIIVQKVTPTIADVPDQTYTGSEITPEPLVIAGSLSLTKGTDYVYSYTNNTNVGTAKVRATFQGTYASLGYVEKEFTILPSTVMVSVTGSGTVTCGDRSATDGTSFGVMSEKGASVALTLAPTDGNAVRSVAYGYTNSKETTASGFKLPVSGTTATLTVPNDLKDGTGVTVTVTFAPALNGGADEASAVALTDATVTDLGGGWYKVENDIFFDHTLNLLGDTHLIIDDGKTMTVNTASNRGIDSDYTLFVSGEGTLSVATTAGDGIAVCVGNYVQTGATVTASGYIGIRCEDDFIGFDFDNDFTFSGGQLTATGSGGGGIDADNDITLSCTNATDFIQASSYSSAHGAVKVADGKALTDGTEASNGMNGYSGTLTYEQRTAIGGKTLRRAVITSYVDASGTLHENVIAIPLDNTMTTLAAGWYVVNSDVAYTGTVTLSGNVKLILGDDCTMSFGKDERLNGTIIECDFNHLTIYGQSGGTGWLKAYSAQDDGIDNVNNYTQNSGNVVISDGNGACIKAGEFTILGGTLDLESQGGGADGEIVTTENINIRGGKLWARYTGLKTMNGKIILDYTNATDEIYVIAYDPQNGLEIANGKTLVDENGTIWSGALDNNQIEHGINGRTLKPLDYTGVTLTKEYYNVSATFSGSSETTVSIPVNVNVTSVTYNRTFTEGRPSTVMLPFSKDVGEISGGTFYTFGGVKKENNKWVATMNAVTGSLTANTPYLFVPTGTSLTFTGGATLNTTGGGNGQTADEGSHWTFKGTYEYMKWTTDTSDPDYNAEREAEIGRAYGFAGVAKTDIEVGDFVRVASGAKIRPMSCYLLWNDTPNNAPALDINRAAFAGELPQRITLRLLDVNGEVTKVGEMDVKTGDVSFDGWYEMSGRMLDGKPTKKGLYINNGRKVVIK